MVRSLTTLLALSGVAASYAYTDDVMTNLVRQLVTTAVKEGLEPAAEVLQSVGSALAHEGAGRVGASRSPVTTPWSPLPGNYFGCFPEFVGDMSKAKLEFDSACGRPTTVVSSTGAAGLQIEVNAGAGGSFLCEDLYLVATPSLSAFSFVSLSGEGSKNATLSSHGNTDLEAWMDTNGAYVFSFLNGTLDTVAELIDTVGLFVPSETNNPVPQADREKLVEFQEAYTNVPVQTRPAQWQNVSTLTTEQVTAMAPAVIAITRFDGLQALQDWGTGAATDHITFLITDSEGTAHVVESTDKTAYWPDHNIQSHTWDEWIPMAIEAQMNLAILPLANKESFDSDKAWTFINSMLGLPYGYWNFLTGFFDTPAAAARTTLRGAGELEMPHSNNLPWPASWQLFEVVFGFIDEVDPDIADQFIGQSLNHHLGTSNLNILQIINAAADKGMNFANVWAVPEQDSWLYTNTTLADRKAGKEPFYFHSQVCDVFACSILKAAGMFGDTPVSCTEWNNKDLYALQVYDTVDPSSRPSACQEADPDLPYCQITGTYRLNLLDFNSRPLRPNMYEHCGALPPDYTLTPSDC